MHRKVAVTFIMGLDCMIDVSDPLQANARAPKALSRELPAPIFALEAPETARADQPFSINAWVGLSDPLHAGVEVLPDSFEARVDPHTRRIIVTGRVRRPLAPPDPDAPQPRLQRALIVGIQVVAPPGMYALEIPESHFAPGAGLPLEPGSVPPPRSRHWLQVRN